MFGTPKRLIVSSTIAVVPADFETSARNAGALAGTFGPKARD